MNSTSPAARLRAAVVAATQPLLALSDADAARRPAPGKWSPKEVIGHLVDSASNNHQRFVRARFTNDLVFPGYEQDDWVRAQGYADAPWSEIVELWRTFNLHLARVMEMTPRDAAEKPRAKHNLDRIGWRAVSASEPVTLAFFMQDYVFHLEHHLRQALGKNCPGFPLDPHAT